MHRGYSLIEVVVVIAILVILSIAIVASVEQVTTTKRVNTTVEAAEQIGIGTGNFHDDTGAWPRNLSHLSTPITTTDLNSCGEPYTGGVVGKWAGPYEFRLWSGPSIPVGVGQLQDTTIRTPPVPGTGGGGKTSGTGQAGTLTIVVKQVNEENAESINELIDGDADPEDGSIRYFFASAADSMAGYYTIHYIIPIGGC